MTGSGTNSCNESKHCTITTIASVDTNAVLFIARTPTLPPPTCSAHGLSNGTNGCYESGEFYVENHSSNTLCFCHRDCQDSSLNQLCCENIVANGCYRE